MDPKEEMLYCSFAKMDEGLKMLLLARKRIVHKAANKLKAFEDIIKKRYQEKGNLKYSLIYVPEGNEPNYLEVEDDTLNQDEDSEHLIDLLLEIVIHISDEIYLHHKKHINHLHLVHGNIQ